jgi:hypothetical protein
MQVRAPFMRPYAARCLAIQTAMVGEGDNIAAIKIFYGYMIDAG